MSDTELRKTQECLKKLLELARKLEKGCWCHDDYRCGNCQTIIDMRFEIAEIAAGYQQLISEVQSND